jgi:hypothetical protein
MITSSVPARDVDPGELVALVDRDRDDPGRADALELLQRGLLDDPFRVAITR